MNRKDLTLSFFLVLLIGYLIRPYYLVVENTPLRVLFFIGLFAFVVLLSWFFYQASSWKKLDTRIKWNKFYYVLLGILVVQVGLFWRLLNVPIRALGTERVHIQQAIAWLEPLHIFGVFNIARILYILVIVTFIVLLCIPKTNKALLQMRFKRFKAIIWKYKTISLGIIFLLIAAKLAVFTFLFGSFFSTEILVGIVEPYGGLMQVSNAIWIFFTGYSPMFIRLLLVAATFATSLVIYNLTKEVSSVLAARCASILYLCIPPITHFAFNFYTLSIQLLLISLSLYSLILFIKQKKLKYISLFTFVTVLGVMYHRVSLIMVPVLAVFMLIDAWDLLKKFKIKEILEKYQYLIYSGIIIFLSFIPKLFVKEIVVGRATLFSFVTEFFTVNAGVEVSQKQVPFSIGHLLVPLKISTMQLTYVLAIIFAIAALYVIIAKRKKELNVLLLFWLITNSFLVMMHIVQPRWLVPAILIVPIVVSVAATQLIKNKILLYGVTAILCIYLLSVSYTSTFNENFENMYLPNDEAYSYIKENVPADATIYRMFMPYAFYERKYNLPNRFITGIWNANNFPEQTYGNFIEYAQEREIDYVLIPVGERDLEKYDSSTILWKDALELSFNEFQTYYQDQQVLKSWTFLTYNQTFIDELVQNTVVEFESGDNGLVLVKLDE